jgi:hypothetical protein
LDPAASSSKVPAGSADTLKLGMAITGAGASTGVGVSSVGDAGPKDAVWQGALAENNAAVNAGSNILQMFFEG